MLVILSRILALLAEKVRGSGGERYLDPLRALLSENGTMLRRGLLIEWKVIQEGRN